MAYRVFRRNWWKDKACTRPVDRLARGTTIKRVQTEEEAREVCRQFNTDCNGERVQRPYGLAYEYEEA